MIVLLPAANSWWKEADNMNSGMKGREEVGPTSEYEINEDINEENERHISKDMTKGNKVDGNENRIKNKNRCIYETKVENTNIKGT